MSSKFVTGFNKVAFLGAVAGTLGKGVLGAGKLAWKGAKAASGGSALGAALNTAQLVGDTQSNWSKMQKAYRS